MAAGLKQLDNPQSNQLIPLDNEDYDDLDHGEDVLRRQSRRSGMLLNSQELISLMHLPSESVRSEKLVRQLKKTKAAPATAQEPGHQPAPGGSEPAAVASSERVGQHQSPLSKDSAPPAKTSPSTNFNPLHTSCCILRKSDAL